MNETMDVVASKNINRFLRDLETQKSKINEIDLWYNGEQPLPRGLGNQPEARKLAEMCRDQYLNTAIRALCSAVQPIRYNNLDGTEHEANIVWTASDMAIKQRVIKEAMAVFGQSFGYLRKEDGQIFMEISTGTDAICFFPSKWSVKPNAALIEHVDWLNGKKSYTFYLGLLQWEISREQGNWVFSAPVAHGFSKIPVYRFVNYFNPNTGSVHGEVEFNIPTIQRIVQDMYNLAAAGYFNSWKIKGATGIELPEPEFDENDDITNRAKIEAAAEAQRMRMSVSDWLLFPTNTDGTTPSVFQLDATDLNQLIAVVEHDVRMLASAMGVPAGVLLGENNQPTAEAVETNETEKRRRAEDMEETIKHGLEYLMGLAAEAMGIDAPGYFSFRSRDTTNIAGLSDALGKMSQMLDVPKTELWTILIAALRLPPETIDQWKQAHEEQDIEGQLLRESMGLTSGTTGEIEAT